MLNAAVLGKEYTFLTISFPFLFDFFRFTLGKLLNPEVKYFKNQSSLLPAWGLQDNEARPLWPFHVPPPHPGSCTAHLTQESESFYYNYSVFYLFPPLRLIDSFARHRSRGRKGAALCSLVPS